MTYDSIVVGGGQAGLAAAYHLQRLNLNYLVLNAGSAPAGSWPRYYDSLTLFSPAEYSSLPGMAFPGDPKRYPGRDDVIGYLTAYANRFGLRVKNETTVADVVLREGVFVVRDREGNEYHARTVVAASGSFNAPRIPEIEGRNSYQGEVLHSMDYREPRAYSGKRVVVAGAANSAVQIAVELAAAAHVTLAVRERIQFMPQTLLGKDIHFWLGKTGLDSTRWLKDQSTPVLDTGRYKKAIRAGKPDVRKMFTGFHATGVEWPSGEKENVDAVILATGFRPNWDYLRSLGVTGDSASNGDIRAGISRRISGLYFVGFSGQRSFSSATLRGVGCDAAFIADHLKTFLRKK